MGCGSDQFLTGFEPSEELQGLYFMPTGAMVRGQLYFRLRYSTKVIQEDDVSFSGGEVSSKMPQGLTRFYQESPV